MQVVLTPAAKEDITQVTAWYAQRSVWAAEEFLRAVGHAFRRIEAQPAAQVVVDAATGTRRALLRKFPHRVLYLIDCDKLVVFAVVHHGRDSASWRERLD